MRVECGVRSVECGVWSVEFKSALRAIGCPLSQPCGLPAPPEGAPRTLPHHLPPPLGEVAEQSEVGGGN